MNLILHESDKKEIVLWHRQKRFTQRELAKIFGTSRSVVYDAIKRYKKWNNRSLNYEDKAC